MTTVKKLKEQESIAEEARKSMYEDTAQDQISDEGANQHPNSEIDQAAQQHQVLETDLVEENRKLDEALKALRGKYNAEVPRLTQQLRDTQLQLEQAKTAQSKAEEEAKQANTQLDEQLNKLREDYGDDIVDVLHTIAQQKQDTSAATVSGETDTDRFWRNLRRRVPDFDDVNSDPKFINWLQTASPSGLTYQQVINEAGNDLDYESCAEIFAQFKQEQQTSKQAAPTAKDFQAPPRGQKRDPQQKKQYTPADWIKFQNDVRKGRYRGREAEAAQLEREIHAAIHGY